MKKAWHRFLQENFNFFRRGGPNIHKERKYEHISISQDFERIEKERKAQRLSLIEYRKKLKHKLLTQKLDLIKEGKESLEQLGEAELLKEAQEAARFQAMSKYGSMEEYKKAIEKEIQTRKIEDVLNRKMPEKSAEELEKELQQLTQDIEEIKKTKKELSDLENKIEDLEPDYVIVTGLKKKLVLNSITYYEFQLRNVEGLTMNPDAMKAIETVHYHVEHNLPVRRELLYEVMPELFDTELGELDQYQRERILSKRPRLISSQTSNIQAIEDVPEERQINEFEMFKKQEYDFMEFVYSKAIEFTEKHEEFIEQKINQGYASLDLVLENIETKPEENLSDQEKVLLKDLQELRRVNQDYAELIKLNKIRVFKKQRELHMPIFVQNHPRLKQAWTEKWEQIVANSFEFRESIFVPDNSQSYESKLDKILQEQRAMDLQELINQSQAEYKEIIGGNEPLRRKDPNKKDDNLLKKLSVLTGAMNQIPETKRRVRTKDLDKFQSPVGRLEKPEESRILLDELTKVLYLNNSDPKKYNLTFWAEHFNIEPQKLRNIFNFVSYPIAGTNEKELGRVIRFIYENEGSNSNKVIDEEQNKTQ
mmetsp:Transcript_28401/g.32841  ORF Transcript_28401/g.32841 Transcript_28401/m.32841 type:complete len:593 (+) Transcript_28401:24-1802(+)